MNRAPSNTRVIRVYLSSSFADMQRERRLLAQRVFPSLRARYGPLGLQVVLVDLHHGVTAAQARDTGAIGLCLDELARCEPWVIGLVGQRYGPPVFELPPGALARHAWLHEEGYAGRSRLEIELTAGALRRSPSARRALVCLRDPDYVASLPRDEQAHYREPDPSGRRHLARLHSAIRVSGVTCLDGYGTPEQAASWIEEELVGLLDGLLQSALPPVIDEDAAGHEDAIEQLERHVAASAGPLVLVGAAGAGKSAVVRSWARRASVRVLAHAADAPGASAPEGVLDSLRQADPDVEDAALDAGVGTRLARGLARIRRIGPVALVLDSADRFDVPHHRAPLDWLPDATPPGVSLIVTCRPGRTAELLSRRGWTTATLPAPHDRAAPEAAADTQLDRLERSAGVDRRVVEELLGLLAASRRGLAEHELGALLSVPPRVWLPVLRLVESALRRVGGRWRPHDDALREAARRRYLGGADYRSMEVHDRLAAYLESASPERCAEEWPMQLAAAGRWDSLAAALQTPDLVVAMWSADRAGVMVLWRRLEAASSYRVDDACRRLLGDVGKWPRLARVVAELAHWAERLPVAERAYRLCPEVDAQIARARVLWQLGRFEEGRQRVTDAVAAARESDPERLADALLLEGAITAESGHPHRGAARAALAEAGALFAARNDILAQAEVRFGLAVLAPRGEGVVVREELAHALEVFERFGDRVRAARCLAALAREDLRLREPAAAWTRLEELEWIARELPHDGLWAQTLRLMGEVLAARGELTQAVERVDRAIEVLRRCVGGEPALGLALLQRAGLALRQQLMEDTEACLDEAEPLLARASDHRHLGRLLSTRAAVRADAGRVDEAFALYGEAAGVARAAGSARDWSWARGQQGELLAGQGRVEDAEAVFKELEVEGRRTEDALSVARATARRATLAMSCGETDRALELARTAEVAFATLEQDRGALESLAVQAAIQRGLRRWPDVLTIQRRAERIARRAGEELVLAGVRLSQAHALRALGDGPGCKAAACEASDLYLRLGRSREARDALALQSDLERDA